MSNVKRFTFEVISSNLLYIIATINVTIPTFCLPTESSSPSSSWCSGAGLFTGKSREQERTRRLTPKPTGTTGFRGAGPASRPALRSRDGAPGPAPLLTWGRGARGVLLTRRRLRDGAGGGGDPAAEGASNAHKHKESQYS